MSVIGEKGVIELDMFNQCMDFYTPGAKTHHVVGFGSNLDQMMVDEFIAAIEAQRDPHVTGEDGLAAVRVAEAGYESARSGATCQIAS